MTTRTLTQSLQSVLLTSFFILACYSFSAFLIFRNSVHNLSLPRWQILTPALLGAISQAVLLRNLIFPQPDLLNLEFFTAFCLVSWLVSLQILISSLYRPLETLGILMFPLSGISAVFASLYPAQQTVSIASTPYLQSHILISVIAYSLLMLSALQALTLAYQDKSIRAHHPGGFIRHLPPLHDMETLLFQMLGFGFIFLTTSLITGFYFVDNLFAQHLVHKTILSIVSWVILAILLFGRFRFGWRGKTAIRWTLTAFIFVMLAYFGSKLVLEFILNSAAN